MSPPQGPEPTTPGRPAAPAGDPRPLLARALDQAGRLVAATEPADAARPTPCGDWDVATLVGHLQGIVRRIGAVLDGRPALSVPAIWESADWPADWAEGRRGTDAVLADDAVLDTVVTVPWGTVTGRSAIGMYLGELATHAWDLAAATGRVDELDAELAAAALPAALEKIPAGDRAGLPFAPAVEVGPEATPYERLVAWEGRDPHWSPGATESPVL